MKRLTLLLSVLLALPIVLQPVRAQVQQWTPENQSWTPLEREVWNGLVSCIEDIMADWTSTACLDADYVGFGSDGIPIPKRVSAAEMEAGIAGGKGKWFHATPLHILVSGDLAVIQYFMYSAMEGADGNTEQFRVAWTDVMRKKDGKWLWISDHGHLVK